jgi:predicted transcriptional regulator
MDIVRVIKSKDYTTICNRIFKDKRLSLKAKGLLAMLLSLSDHWELSIKGLEVILKEGRTSIRSTMNELIENGYVERQQIRENNKFIGVDYIVFELPKSQNLTAGNLTSQNQTQVSNNLSNNQFNKANSKNQFFDEVMSFKDFSKAMLNDFFEYWSEPTKKGVLKKDTMKTWSTSRRLKNWAKNESKWALQSVGISKVDKHLQSHNEAMNILNQLEHDKKNR